MTVPTIFDDRRCQLGEGPLWHPLRQQLFWFDILGKRLLTRTRGVPREWAFDEYVSAAGWVDRDQFLIASESGLYRFDLTTGERALVVALEADQPATRSNDGRADPMGGFWIGTMGKQAEPGAGAIYRFYKGALRKLFPDITVSNAICFAPDGRTAYFADTADHRILRQPLDAEGWPKGSPSPLIDLRQAGLNPDGAVVDAEGCIWNAQWGASRIARYDADGQFMSAVDFPASQISCPAFGGDGLTTMFATSAADGVDEAQAGQVFQVAPGTHGQQEHRVIL